ncbi:MAG TPA: metallophosphoesterase [Parafilimonas sp.]|nr:metallophosphoesterase [Parafilimonas sp.]
MLKNILHVIFFMLVTATFATAQDSIVHRVIFIGDAGEMNADQKAVIQSASEKILSNKTTVIYLGDNIYPTGMALPGTKNETQTKEIMQSQFVPMRSKGAPVYFIPGNHDWDRMGSDGLEKIKLQWQYLNNQHDSLVKLVPANGCPDPYEIEVSDSMVIIAFDSEWWLFPFGKNNPDAMCECKTKDEITARFEELFYKNRYKTILLASHHPFQTYGRHGGYYSWKDHLFPFTAVNKNFYLPLPVIGSLYPLLRKTFPSAEDMGHPLYEDMIRKVNGITNSIPNVIHVAGHEHTLQFIKNDQIQIVSGAGSKNSYVRKKHDLLFGETAYGFVTADQLINNQMRFTYYTLTDSNVSQSFDYTQPYVNVAMKETAALQTIAGDSIIVAEHASFNEWGKFHRFLLGENYRKEYATPTTLPVIRISSFKGGLTPVKRGGGHQSRSLRLKDNNGNEWALRSVDKYPEVLLPEQLRETFASDWIKDAMSAQHPYAALSVPVVANAVNVPHTNPVIGFVAPDARFGVYSRLFANTVCLLEEREPLGKSDNTMEMLAALNKDNDNSIDSSEFFRARLLDLFLGDWDRHEDQWRWVDTKKGSEKKYIAVPRDRDQVFHLTEGIFPTSAARPWVAPFLHNFDGEIKKVNAFFFGGKYLNARFLNQFDHDAWMRMTKDFTAAVTDSVLHTALLKLPAASYKLRGEILFNKWHERRQNMPAALEKYYYFFNRIIDITTSDKNELVEINDTADNGLNITIHKISKERSIKGQIYQRTFYPSETKEIRIFVAKGNDSVVINNHSSIKLRIIGGDSSKVYNVIGSKKKIRLYDNPDNAVFEGEAGKLHKRLSNDSLNTAIIPTNLYNVTAPMIDVGYNVDDGLIFGLGLKHTQQGFRKMPYASVQQFTVAHSFSTKAYRIRYKGEWIRAVGNADITLQGFASAPENTINFFGRGNETEFDKTGDYKTYYRTRFGQYQVYAALRWGNSAATSFSIGPAIQYYHFDSSDNKGRFIVNTGLINSYDSNTIAKDKGHAGLVAVFTHDMRNNKLLPSWGSYINIQLNTLAGLNKYSKSFVQLIPEAALYKSVNARSTVVIAERLGGMVTLGKTTFYQSAFLGGQGNLFGYKQYRFAGGQMLYNNLEARIKLANFASYIFPGQIGIIGFYDVGRVWVKEENSRKWHNGAGGGLYFAPAQMAVLRIVAGYSREGWYPYIALGFRF